nr:unnamed protein product [Callosobruchus analis]
MVVKYEYLQCLAVTVSKESDTESNDEPFRREDDTDEYQPISEDSSDADTYISPKKSKSTPKLQTTKNVAPYIGNNAACRSEENDPSGEKQIRKRNIFNNEKKTTRKWSRKQSSWKKNIAALARQRGETYVDQRGRTIPAKVVNLGTICSENCKKKCSDQLGTEERQNIFPDTMS